MPAAISALDSGNPDGEDDSRKASKLAARAARFNKVLPGNRYKQLEEMRIKERKAFEQQGLIKVGKTELGDAVDMRGTCEMMCSEYEREFREYTREVHPFEKMGSEGRMDPSKAVAAYSRSDAGAGHGDSAILPSDLRTPATLVRTLDYLFSVIMPTLPPSTSTSPATPRKALGYSAGFIRDRTRAIRKEFAMQSSWGHEEAIASFERIARWHILCLRELQEESGTNVDMHIDSAELNRCFTSLRQHYNDRREELGIEAPCPNEAEFTAYMLIYDLNSKSVSIPFSELPSLILDHPLVKMAWEIRRAAQRNFDTQKEGSKHNAELGMNLITRFVKLLKQPKIPYLLACLVEIRLREMRRSAIRALRRPYPALKTDAIRVNEMGEIIERKMILLNTLNRILGCEEQENEDSAWDDIDFLNKNPDQESIDISRRFGFEIYEDDSGPIGALINLGSPYDDNKDAPHTRRWKLITEKRGNASYVDIVNGQAGVQIEGTTNIQPTRPTATNVFTAPKPTFISTPTSTSAFSFKPPRSPAPAPVQRVPKTEPTIFKSFCPPPDHPDVIAKKNKELIPGPPPLLAGPTKGIFAEPYPYTTKEVGDALNRTDSIFNKVAPQDKPAAPSPSFTFTPQQAPKTSSKKKRSAEEDSAPPAKAPLFSSAGFFSAPSPAATSLPSSSTAPVPSLPPLLPTKAASPTLPPFSVPKPISSVATSPLTESTFSPTRQRKRTASSVLSSSTAKLSSSVLRKSLADVHKQREEQLNALPEICDMLVDEVIQSMIEDHLSADLTRYVKQQKAATEYQRRKVLRSEAILHWSQGVFHQLVDHETERIARVAVLEELKRRYLTRRAIRYWKSWAKLQRQNREQSEKKRVNMYTYLNGMGLSKSISSLPAVSRSDTTTPISDIDMSLEIERLDSLQIDIEINHAERTKDNFFSPSTFLLSIIKHVGPFLSPQASSESTFLPAFHTIVSIPTPGDEEGEFGSPPDKQVQDWLNRKFLQPNRRDGHDVEEEENYVINGVMYESKILEAGKSKLPGWCSIGLYVFEVPLKTDDEVKNAQNITDCQDRIGVFVKGLQASTNRYIPSLLILSWEQESIEDLGERLQISEELEMFTRKALVSLHYSDDLDERFSKALEVAIPDLTIKEQLVIRLNDVISTLYPTWQRYLDISLIHLTQKPKDINLASSIFTRGIELINSIPQLTRSTLGPLHLEDEEKWDPIVLPDFKEEKDELPFELVERIVEYSENDLLKGIDDLDLSITPLRQAAFLGQPLSPIITILRSISYLVLGELKDTTIELRFFPDENSKLGGIDSHLKSYLRNLQRSYEKKMNEIMNSIFMPLPSSNDDSSHSQTTTTTMQIGVSRSPIRENGTNKKRNRTDENTSPDSQRKKESKALKNARLLRTLKDVEKTLALSQLDGNGNELEVN
ncbi:hypothetical protein V865_000516 [Kwoniella europaea PYCC6329]|uniref:SAC3/GANP/THP3 conserved domain-containing protein n=1 Tax=Kwoniella europaea PYCC6329 TaxID=1423913 RepID=A0AAX4K7R7_9TREE